MSSHTPIRIYTGDLILGVNTLYRLLCFFKLLHNIMVGKGLNSAVDRFHCTAINFGVSLIPCS